MPGGRRGRKRRVRGVVRKVRAATKTGKPLAYLKRHDRSALARISDVLGAHYTMTDILDGFTCKGLAV